MGGLIIALAVTLVLPAAGFYLVARRLGTGRPVFLGAACFVIFQVLTRIPLLQAILPRSPHYLLFQATRPVLFLVFLSLTAGLFEEIGRWLIMGRFMNGAPLRHAAAFGLGHGGIEAILLAGLSFAAAAVFGQWSVIPPMQFIWGALERVFAMAFHIGLSILVWRSLSERRPVLLWAAVLLHTMLNAMAAWLAYRGAPLAAVEGAIGLFVLCFLLYTFQSARPHGRDSK